MRFSPKLNDSTTLSKNIKTFFDKDQIEKLARETGFVKRRRILTGFDFLNLCVFGVFKEGLSMSLVQLCCFLHKSELLISSESLNQRFNNSAVLFMKKLFELALVKFLDTKTGLNFLKSFNGVYIQDSTSFQLPSCFSDKYPGSGGGASGAALKIDLTYNIQNGKSLVSVVPGNESDHKSCMGNMKKGSLLLRDLGYFKLNALELMNDCSTYYISRLRSSVNIYRSPEKDAEMVDLEEYASSMRENEIMDIEVYLGNSKRIPVRLVVQKTPHNVSEQKKYNLKKDRKRRQANLSSKRLNLCALTMMITNIPVKKMRAKDVFRVYKIRWQIELIFKIWKSQYQIHTIKKMKIERMECQLYSRLIFIILNTMIMTSIKIQFWNDYGIDLSETKAMQLLRDTKHSEWLQLILKTPRKIKAELHTIFILLYRYAQKSYKINKFSPLQLSLT